jgi:hypothetical protein
MVDPVIAEATADTARRQLARTAAGRARRLAAHERPAQAPAASRTCRPKRSQNFAGVDRARRAGYFWLARSSPPVDPAISDATADAERTGSLPDRRGTRPSLAARERPRKNRRLAGVPREALVEFPAAWGECVRAGEFLA